MPSAQVQLNASLAHAIFHPSVRRSASSRTPRAFTLIEILVVLGIIAILASVSLVVASRVTQGGKDRLTTDTIRVLDQVAQSYISAKEKIPTKFKDVTNREFALIDARLSTADVYATPEPSLALFLLLVSDFSSAEQGLKAIDPRLIDRATDASTANISNPLYSTALGALPQKDDNGNNAHLGLTVKDAWGRPIRFVHPAYHGGYGDGRLNTSGVWSAVTRDPLKVQLGLGSGTGIQMFTFRRSATPFDPATPPAAPAGTTKPPVGDADEGLAAGNLPYFYSAGADGDPGTREDNGYSIKPNYPKGTSGR